MQYLISTVCRRDIVLYHTQAGNDIQKVAAEISSISNNQHKLQSSVEDLSQNLASIRLQISTLSSAEALYSNVVDQLTAIQAEVHCLAATKIDTVHIPGFRTDVEHVFHSLVASKELSNLQCGQSASSTICGPSSIQDQVRSNGEAASVSHDNEVESWNASRDPGACYIARSKPITHNEIYHCMARTRFGSLGIRVATTTRDPSLKNSLNRAQARAVISFLFHPAQWLVKFGLNRGFEAALTLMGDRWKFKITPVCAVRDDALIFRFCIQNNIQAIQELFSRGDASVMDVNSGGFTPLHVGPSYKPRLL